MAYRLLGLTLLAASTLGACATDGTSDPFRGDGGGGGELGIGGAGGARTDYPPKVFFQGEEFRELVYGAALKDELYGMLKADA